jgi:hypothetical protein
MLIKRLFRAKGVIVADKISLRKLFNGEIVVCEVQMLSDEGEWGFMVDKTQPCNEQMCPHWNDGCKRR